VPDGFEADVVCPSRFPAEVVGVHNELIASGHIPIPLIVFLIGDVSKEIPANPIVVKERFIPIFPFLDEVVGKSVNQESFDCNIHAALPRPRHSAQPFQIAISFVINFVDDRNFRARVTLLPFASVVRIREKERLV
jgi:hypothetical protein